MRHKLSKLWDIWDPLKLKFVDRKVDFYISLNHQYESYQDWYKFFRFLSEYLLVKWPFL